MNPNLKIFLIVIAALAAWAYFIMPRTQKHLTRYKKGREMDPEDKIYEVENSIKSDPKHAAWKAQIQEEAEQTNTSFHTLLRKKAVEYLKKTGH